MENEPNALEFMGFTAEELNELVTIEQTQQNIQKRIEEEVFFMDYDEEKDRYNGVADINEMKFNEFMDEYCKTISSAMLRAPYIYNPVEGYWQETITKDLGAHLFNAIIEPTVTQFDETGWLYQFKANRDKIRHVCNRYAQKSASYDATPLLNEPNPNLIMFENGVYDFATNEVRNGTMDDYQTFKLKYPLVKTEEKTLAEEWLEFLVGDSIKMLKQLIGYLFYRSYKYNVYTFFINGKDARNGNNGKSSVLNFINLLVSQNSSSVSIRDLDGKNKFATSRFYNKLVNFETDAPDVYLEDNATLKTLSGNDPIDAEFKGKDAFQFRNYAKLIFATNYLPKVKDTSESNASRLLILPFSKSFENGKYKEELTKFNQQKAQRESKDELGRFAWICIQEFREMLLAHPSDRNPFDKTEEQLEAIQNYISDNNQVLQFIKDNGYIITGNEQDRIPAKDLYLAFKTWCESEEISHSYSTRTFKSKLDAMGVVNKAAKISGKTVKSYVGIKEYEENGHTKTELDEIF